MLSLVAALDGPTENVALLCVELYGQIRLLSLDQATQMQEILKRALYADGGEASGPTGCSPDIAVGLTAALLTPAGAPGSAEGLAQAFRAVIDAAQSLHRSPRYACRACVPVLRAAVLAHRRALVGI